MEIPENVDLDTGDYNTIIRNFASLRQDPSNVAGVIKHQKDMSRPGMCAALNRHVAHLPQSQWSTPSLYYQAAPANYYSKFWHDHNLNRLSYGFPYDDYAEQSSFVSHGMHPGTAVWPQMPSSQRSVVQT